MRSAPARFTFWIRAVQLVALAVAVSFSLGASSAAARFDDLGGRLMCTCGCAQLLGGCDHVGCPSRGQEMTDLQAQLNAGKSDPEILNWFAAKYGATVLAAPPARGFDLIAWIAPFAVFAAALLGTILLIRHWGSLPGAKTEAVSNPANMDPAERARIDRIRQETGMDGGF